MAREFATVDGHTNLQTFVYEFRLRTGRRCFVIVGFRIGVLFFLWIGIFNLFVIAQFWAFANDLYTW